MPPDQETGDQTDWIFVQLALVPCHPAGQARGIA